MCLYPKLIKNKKYVPNKKNGGIAPPLTDIRTLYVPIGCQDCIECRKQKSREWNIRLQEEIKESRNGKFVTLTFSTEAITKLYKEVKETRELEQWEAIMDGKTGKDIPETLTGYKLDNAAATLGTRRFLERWRKRYKKSVKHWLVTEIGGKNWQHIHIHGIIWTDEKIEPIWQYGGVFLGRYREERAYGRHYVNEKTIGYVTKYIQKVDIKHKSFKSKVLTSAGIGKKYEESLNFKNNKYEGENTREYYKNNAGYKMALPIYYRNKRYTEEEKEKLWIAKLDKPTRWVGGTEIKITGNKEEDSKRVNELLKEARDRSRRLNYGTNESWKHEEWETSYREILQQTRIQAALNKSVTYEDAYKKIREKLY